MPWAPPIWATQMRSATTGYPRASARGRRLRRRCRRFGLLGLLGHHLTLLARDGAGRIVALLAFHQAGLVEKAQHAVGRQRTLGDPGLGLLEVELEALGLLLRQQRIEVAQALDEAAVARRAAVGNHDVIDRPLLGAGASKSNLQRHSSSFRCSLCP